MQPNILMPIIKNCGYIYSCPSHYNTNWLVWHTPLLSPYSFVRRIVLLCITHPLLGGCALQWSLVSRYTSNKASKLKMLQENGNHGRAVDCRYVTHHLTPFITKAAQHDTSCVHSPHQYEEKAAYQSKGPKNTCTYLYTW